MRHIGLAALMFTMTSCGLYDDLFTTFVTYNSENQRKQKSMPYFFGFNQAPMDSLLNGIDEKATAKYRLIVDKQGRVIKYIELKNTFTVGNQEQIRKQIENLEYLPYLEDEMSTTVFKLKRKRTYSTIVDTGLRLKKNGSLRKYGVD